MCWVPEHNPKEPDEANPLGKNSIALLQQVKKWEMDLPDMSLCVHGGSNHPLSLIEERGLKEQKEDFLKSRPRFNDSYFDGQRDPTEGVDGGDNAWRNPAFYVGAQLPHARVLVQPATHALHRRGAAGAGRLGAHLGRGPRQQ